MPDTLLAIFAHPDDEAFGSGGTLARCAARGDRVVLLCATRGESGKITDPDLEGESDIGALRQAELQTACAALGIMPPRFLGFHDSGRQERVRREDPKALMNVDELELEQAILPHIAELEPQVLLTFDPHGFYGHVDHLKVHRAATAAFWSAGGVTARPPRRLFYSAVGIEALATMRAARPTGPLADVDPSRYGVSEDSFAVVARVDDQADRKWAAIMAHRSQVGPRSSFGGMDRNAWDAFIREERFTLGGLRGSFPAMPVDDLFAGLEP